MKKHPAKKSQKRDQYTVVLEDIRDQFRAFGDGLMGVHQKLDTHSKEFTAIHKTLDSHTQMIGQLMLDMEEVKYELKKRPTFDDLKAIEKRLARLEARR